MTRPTWRQWLLAGICAALLASPYVKLDLTPGTPTGESMPSINVPGGGGGCAPGYWLVRKQLLSGKWVSYCSSGGF